MPRILSLFQNRQGFTLVELLVAVVVIGVLVAIAVPVFLDQKQSARESTAKANINIAARQAAAHYAQTGSTTGFTRPSDVSWYSGPRRLKTTTPATCQAYIKADGSYVPGKEPTCGPLSAAILNPILEDEPIGYWTLDQTSGLLISDDSGYGNDGLAIGPPTFGADGPPVSGDVNSFNFDSINDTIRVNNSSSMNPTSGVTIEAWVKVSPTTQAFMVVDKTGQYRMRINGGKYACYFSVGGTTLTHQSTAIIDDGAWHHIACTYGASKTIKIYKDGVLNTSKNVVGGNLNTTINDTYLGSFDNLAQYYGGDLAQIAIFNRELSAARILAHYHA